MFEKKIFDSEIVAKNIRAYIHAVNKSEEWICKRSGIAQADFIKLLNGEGNVERDVPKINKLFRIKNARYFYNENIKLPLTLDKIENMTLRNFTLNGDNKDSEAFKETMCILEDVINMIHVLKTAKEMG